MGYSKSTAAIDRVRSLLRQLVIANGDEVAWPNEEPDKLAYYIREGINSAIIHADESTENTMFAKLKTQYVIKSKAGRTIASPRSILPIENLKQSMQKMVLNEPISLLEVVGAAIKHKAPEMYFPNADIDDLNKLYAWTSKNDYFIIKGEGITLTKTASNLAWLP